MHTYLCHLLNRNINLIAVLPCIYCVPDVIISIYEWLGSWGSASLPSVFRVSALQNTISSSTFSGKPGKLLVRASSSPATASLPRIDFSAPDMSESASAMILSRAHSAILFGNTVTFAKNDFLNPNRLVAPFWTTDLDIHRS
jgi:hypothetical protein